MFVYRSIQPEHPPSEKALWLRAKSSYFHPPILSLIFILNFVTHNLASKKNKGITFKFLSHNQLQEFSSKMPQPLN